MACCLMASSHYPNPTLLTYHQRSCTTFVRNMGSKTTRYNSYNLSPETRAYNFYTKHPVLFCFFYTSWDSTCMKHFFSFYKNSCHTWTCDYHTIWEKYREAHEGHTFSLKSSYWQTISVSSHIFPRALNFSATKKYAYWKKYFANTYFLRKMHSLVGFRIITVPMGFCRFLVAVCSYFYHTGTYL